MSKRIDQRYLETSVYTYVGIYKEFILSLPHDIPSIGRLLTDIMSMNSVLVTANLIYHAESL